MPKLGGVLDWFVWFLSHSHPWKDLCARWCVLQIHLAAATCVWSCPWSAVWQSLEETFSWHVSVNKQSVVLFTFFSSLKEAGSNGQFLWGSEFAKDGSSMFEPLLRYIFILTCFCGINFTFNFIFWWKLTEWVRAFQRFAERISISRGNLFPWWDWVCLWTGMFKTGAQ